MADAWPPLPSLESLVYSLPGWPYPVYSPLAATPAFISHAHLRLYTSSDGGHVAIFEDSITSSLSIADGAQHIWDELCDDFPGGPITQIELYRCARGGGPGVHFDQYNGSGLWSGSRRRPLSDVALGHPDVEVAAWTARYRGLIVGGQTED